MNIVEFISSYVDGLLKDESHLGRRNLLLKVKALVNGTSIPDFFDDLSRGCIRFSVFQKIQNSEHELVDKLLEQDTIAEYHF